MDIRSLISFHQNDLDVVTIKSTVISPNQIIRLKVIIKSSFNGQDAHHKLSLTICDYEQLIPIGYNYNQFEINDVS